MAMFKALLLATWYDLSDVTLAEALADRASFRRFCGFSRDEATPERTRHATPSLVQLRRSVPSSPATALVSASGKMASV